MVKESKDTYQSIWDTLSVIDVTDHVQKKNNLSYLSWAYAWGVLMEHYPSAEYFFEPNEFHPDGSCTVHCTVTIGECHRSMFLPCMTGFKNTATPNPNARDLGDAKMRCLTKCFGMFGLAHYLYAGEDLPHSNERTRSNKLKGTKETKEADDTEPSDVHRAVEEVLIMSLGGITDGEELKKFWTENRIVLKKMEAEDPERYSKVLGMFKDAAKKIEV